MQKLIRRQTLLVIFLFLLEICAAGALFFLLDNPNLELFINDILIGSIFVIILINLMIILAVINKISNARMKTDISSLSVIGSDIQEAYDFGKLGLIVTDDNDEVIWTNKLFERLQNKLMDRSIFAWQEDLRELQEGKLNEKKIKISSRVYLVKYLKEAHLYIFKDITDVEDLNQASFDQSPVIGIVSIDNYQDMANIFDETSMNDSIASIQKSLLDYAKTYNLLLKKFKTDSYLFICENINFQQLVTDKFSILKTVRDISRDKDAELTISIGIALGIKEYSRLYEFASSALDVALSRGGNQCVVSNYGENLKFYGGQTEAKVSKNAVKSRVNANSLYTHMEEALNVFVMGHGTADFDAIGACLGIYSIGQNINVKVKIIYDEDSIDKQTKNAFKKMYSKEQIQEMCISSSKAIDEFKANSLLVVVDVNDPDRVIAPAILKKAEKIIVIDHHRPGKKHFDSTIMSYIDASASSTCELIAEMVKYGTRGITVTPSVATFMLSGIILDTNYYRTHMGAKTYDASYILKSYGADNSIADSFFKEEFETYSLKTKIMANSLTPYTGIVVCMADQRDIIERAVLSKVGNEYVSVSGVNAVFVIGRISEREVYISARSDGSVSVQLLCEKLGGGGHYTLAAAGMQRVTIEDAKNKLLDVLEQYLEDARAKRGEE